MKYAGKDATSAYEPIHPPDALEKNLPPEKHLGALAAEDAQALQKVNEERKKTKDELRMAKAQKEKPPLSRILNAQEMEVRYSIYRIVVHRLDLLSGHSPESYIVQSLGVLLFSW